jgi:hypothetical protein
MKHVLKSGMQTDDGFLRERETAVNMCVNELKQTRSPDPPQYITKGQSVEPQTSSWCFGPFHSVSFLSMDFMVLLFIYLFIYSSHFFFSFE